MDVNIRVRRRPSEGFGPAPLGYPPTPPVDLGAGLVVGQAVTVRLDPDAGSLLTGTVAALDAEWITVTVGGRS